MMDVRVMAMLLAFVLFAATASAHHPILNGTTVAPAFSTWRTALKIPTNKFSLSVKRLSDCKNPYFWLKYTGKRGDVLDVSASTTAAAGMANVRLSVAVFGPGLPKLTKKLAFAHPHSVGRVFTGPTSVSSCSFIKNADKRSGYGVVKGRCGLVSGKSSYFPILDNAFKLPASGTFYFAFFTQGQYTAWYSVGTGSTAHVHGKATDYGLPKVAPVGNGPKGLNFYDSKAKSTCCASRCPAARKVYA